MKVDLRQADDVMIVDLEGRLVTGGAENDLRQVMNQMLVEGRRKILLNLSRVAWIDSAGIGELVASIKLAKQFNTSVKLLRLGDRVRHVLSISKLLPVLEIYEDEDEALQSFDSPEDTPAPFID